MSDEDKINKALGRAARAEALLRDELLTEAWATIDKELIDLWRHTKGADERDRIWTATQIAERVQGLLRTAIVNGRIAQSELDAIIGKQKRAKS